MTPDEMIELATTAYESCNHIPNLKIPKEFIEIFAKLVADKRVEGMVVMTPDEFKSVWDKAQAEEREACAQVACSWNFEITDKVAEEIRARTGEQA